MGVLYKPSRGGKFLLAGLILIAIVGAGLVFSRANRPATVRAYFGLERTWSEHWPFQRGKDALQDLEPKLLALGILGPARVEVEPGVSFFLDPRDLVPVSILRSGEWQPEIWSSISPALSNGSVFLDVGAHIGYFSMKAALKVGKPGHVVAFEPNPETLKLLRDNVIANKAENVIVEPIACTDREQTLTFYAAPVMNTSASSLARSNADISGKEAPRAYAVRGRPIDDVVRELNLTRVDAIKIDVEGAEVYVLRGAANTLKRFHPKVVVEVVPEQLANMQTTPADLASVMKTAGYNRSKPLNASETDWEWIVQDPRDMSSTIRVADPSTSGQLIHGFYGLEQKAWRWTAGRFTVALRRPPEAGRNGAVLVLDFTIPDVSLKKLKSMTLTTKLGGLTLKPETYVTQGPHQYRRDIPVSALREELVDVDFVLDKVLGPPEHSDELGVIVTAVTLSSK